GGGIDFAGFAPDAVRARTCLIVNTIGPDRRETFGVMLEHLAGLDLFDAAGAPLAPDFVRANADRFAIPVRERYQGERGYHEAGFREPVGDYHVLFTDLQPEVLARYGRVLAESPRWLQRRVKYAEFPAAELAAAAELGEAGC